MTIEMEPGERITPEIMIPDLLRSYPQARPVFDRYGLHGCGGPFGPYESIAFFARAHEVDLRRLMDDIEQAITSPGCCPSAGGRPEVVSRSSVADTIYRRFFLAGTAVILTLGATWGAALLWRIGFGHSFAGVRVHEINAHAQAQVFGWMGFFIMGFAYQAFPRFWHTTLVRPQLAVVTFWTLLAGVLAASVGQALVGYSQIAPYLAGLGAGLELLAVLTFVFQIARTFQASGKPLEPYTVFIGVAFLWFILGAAVNLVHTWKTATAATASQLLECVTVCQPVLRDMQFHGLGITLILGVSLRTLPHLFGLPLVPYRAAMPGLALLTAAIAAEIGLTLALRPLHSEILAWALPAVWLALLSGVLLVIVPFRLWKPFPEPERSAKFIRAAYGWLVISLAMLLLSPAYLSLARAPFSHAYFGAVRHAITVGFISLMIMAYAAKVVPTLNGIDTRKLTPLWGPFVLVNLGCFSRVVMQTLTDWNPSIFPYIGVSGTLEVVGLAWWGVHLAGIILRGARDTGPAQEPPGRPASIAADHRVADVLSWYPTTEAVFLLYGFSAIGNPVMRSTVARHTTIARACLMHGIPLDEFLTALNQEVARVTFYQDSAGATGCAFAFCSGGGGCLNQPGEQHHPTG